MAHPTCLHPPRMKLSREVAYKYITIRTQYSYWPSQSDFPFCSAQRDSTSRVSSMCVACLRTRKNIIQSIHRPVLFLRKWKVDGRVSILVSPFLAPASFRISLFAYLLVLTLSMMSSRRWVSREGGPPLCNSVESIWVVFDGNRRCRFVLRLLFEKEGSVKQIMVFDVYIGEVRKYS